MNAIVSINPPPRDGRCNCCGTHVSELKPFGGAGDPLVGDFSGALLVKMFRSMHSRNQAADDWDKLVESIYGGDAPQRSDEEKTKEFEKGEERLRAKYGNEWVEQRMFRDQLENTVEASWECRDCIVLDGVEYDKKRWTRIHAEEEVKG